MLVIICVMAQVSHHWVWNISTVASDNELTVVQTANKSFCSQRTATIRALSGSAPSLFQTWMPEASQARR